MSRTPSRPKCLCLLVFFRARKRVVSKRVVLADVPPERKPERGYVRQDHPFTKPPFYLPMSLFGVNKFGWFPKGRFRRMLPRNENRNEGTFAKTTLLQNRPFISPGCLSAGFRGLKCRFFLKSQKKETDKCKRQRDKEKYLNS